MSWLLLRSLRHLLRLRETGQMMHDRAKSSVRTKRNRAARGWKIHALASARGEQNVMAAICNQDLCSPARERNFRPSDSRRARLLRAAAPWGERSCHLIPKVSRANITPAISQVLRAESSHFCEGSRTIFFFPLLSPPAKKIILTRARARGQHP